ncbi:hypothetical protein G6F46_013354 [Rhizopus delemar]|nr:hypothetical protein G6F46_013354 [Rhizopus delemar]
MPDSAAIVFVVPRVLPHDQRRQVLVDDGLGHARGQRHIAQAHDAVIGFHFDDGPAVEAERAHSFLLGIQQVHGVGAEVALGRHGLAGPFENTGADGFDLHVGFLLGRRETVRYAHAAGDLEGLPGGLHVGAALARDVVSGAVRRRGDGDRQAALHRHPAREAQQLDRDLTLVVVHGDDRLELAGLRSQEDGVGGERSLHGQPLLVQLAHGGRDNVDLFAAARAAVAAPGATGRSAAWPP